MSCVGEPCGNAVDCARGESCCGPYVNSSRTCASSCIGTACDGERIAHQGKRAAMENVPRIALFVAPIVTAVKIHGAVAEEPQSRLIVRAARPV